MSWHRALLRATEQNDFGVVVKIVTFFKSFDPSFLDAPDQKTGDTPLHISAKNGNYVREIGAIARVATWHETNQKYAVGKRQQANDKAIASELTQANEELKILRHKRLKELYTAEWQQFEQELNDQGLAILKDRD